MIVCHKISGPRLYVGYDGSLSDEDVYGPMVEGRKDRGEERKLPISPHVKRADLTLFSVRLRAFQTLLAPTTLKALDMMFNIDKQTKSVHSEDLLWNSSLVRIDNLRVFRTDSIPKPIFQTCWHKKDYSVCQTKSIGNIKFSASRFFVIYLCIWVKFLTLNSKEMEKFGV